MLQGFTTPTRADDDSICATDNWAMHNHPVDPCRVQFRHR